MSRRASAGTRRLLPTGCEERAGGEMRVIPIRAESPFTRYRGIGNPGIGSGKKCTVSRLCELHAE